MDAKKIAKSGQEQAVAAWIGYLNQLRIDGLLEALRNQQTNLEAALESVDRAMRTIDIEVIVRNRGGQKGMHGFIAEVAEVGVGNARRLVVGEDANLEWLNDNGPVDIVRDGMVDIQQKFVNSGGGFSLGAVAEHLRCYPNFIENGGKYQIPADHYEKVKMLLEMPRDEAAKLARSGDGPSLRDWKHVQSFFDESGLGIDDLEPSRLSYDGVQRDTIHATLDDEKEQLRQTAAKRNEQAYQESLPSLKEGAKTTVASAAIEGGTAFAMKVAEKRRSGKKFADFDSQDWEEIAAATGAGFGKGGVRGVSIYALTNFTATSAAVASALVTSSFGIAEQANRLRQGEIGEVEFIENAELLALDASVSALSSFIGQALIPVPVIGAVVGNTVGMVMYQAAKDGLSKREQEIIEAYAQQQRELDVRLAEEYGRCIELLNAGMASYLDLLERAFDPNPALAFEGSIMLAREVGVADGDLLDTREKAAAYFMG